MSFMTPSAPPPPPRLPEAPQAPDAPSKTKRRRPSTRAQTLLTSGQGVMDPVKVGRKTLLGG